MAEQVKLPEFYQSIFNGLIHFEIEYALEKNNISKSLIKSPLGKAQNKICSAIIYVFSHDITFDFVDKIFH